MISFPKNGAYLMVCIEGKKEMLEEIKRLLARKPTNLRCSYFLWRVVLYLTSLSRPLCACFFSLFEGVTLWCHLQQ